MKLLVFLLLPCLSLSELSPGFGKCKQFFLEDRPPAFSIAFSVISGPPGTTVQEICQCVSYNDNNNNKKIMYVYATLYNTDWRIPIYSAYVFKKSESVRSVGRCDAWYIEPQLDGETNSCMGSQGHKSNIGDNQAVNIDYDKSGYNKGHLYPIQHTDTHVSMLATSTLTNAAPQDAEFNKGKWCKHEKDVIEELNVCDKAYVVTGVVPDLNIKIPKRDFANVNSRGKQKYERVTVSKYYWRAYCCEKKNSQNKLEYTGRGYIGPVGNNKIVKELSITDLQTQLATEYGGVNVVIFPSQPNPPIPPYTGGHKRSWTDEPTDEPTDECTGV